MTNDPSVLLVEDNPDDQELALRALRRNNISDRVQVADDGQEALDFLLAQGPWSHREHAPLPSFVLLDLKIPKLDGFEVLRQLRAHQRTRLLPVVVLSSSKDESDLARAYQAGANSYLCKPVDFTQFIETVRQMAIYWMGLNLPPPPAHLAG
jgi:two-component system response regulator